MQALDSVRASAFARLPKARLAEIADDPDVEAIEPDRPVSAFMDVAAAAVNAGAAANYGLDGSGIGIAVLDSGVSKRNDLDTTDGTATRVVYREDFTGSGSKDDFFGHGSHVAATIAGNGWNSSIGNTYSRTFKGIAPKANIVSFKVLNDTGVGKDSWVISAIQRAIALKSTYNIRVMNISLGRPVYASYANDPLCQAVESAVNAGIVVVVAAGNHGRLNTNGIKGYGTITSPGNHPAVITVGSMKPLATKGRSDDQMASYSSKGPTIYDHVVKPDLVAPGNQIVSMLSNSYNTNTLNMKYPVTQVTYSYYIQGSSSTNMSTAYFRLNGTSMAAPIVSGAAALLIQKNPSLTPGAVKARLMKTASKAFPSSTNAKDPATGTTYTIYYDAFTVGAGYVDIAAALANNDSFSGTARSPVAVYSSSTDSGSFQFASGSGLGGSNLTWGTNLIWGTTSVSGSNLIWGVSTKWATNIIWGTSTSSTSGFNLIWGTGLNGTVSPANIIWGTTSGDVTAAAAVGILTRGE